MALLTVNIWDATGAKRQEVQVPADAPVNRILAVLLEKMHFPQYGPDGQLLSYKLHHRNSGKQLLDDQTLANAGVKDGDVLRLQPEITAGFQASRTRRRVARIARVARVARFARIARTKDQVGFLGRIA